MNGLVRNAALLFGVYLVASVVAFWPSYLSRLEAVPNLTVHIHGWLMAGWLVLLLAQALLVRLLRPRAHRRLGKLSIALAPAVALSIALAAHSAATRGEIDETAAARLALQLGYVPLFLTIWGLGLRNRRTPGLHARFMMCTVIPMTSPVFDRILGFYLMPQMAFLPQFPDGSRLLPLIYLVLLALGVRDWRNRDRSTAFLLVGGLFLAQHASVLVVYRMEWWQSFCRWFVTLPLTQGAGMP